MRKNWKLLAGFSLFGAVISLISGIAGGNPFGIILLRGVFSALVFAGLSIAVQAVLRRFVPDLMGAPPTATQSRGGSVDIIIDEELPRAVDTGSPEGGEVEQPSERSADPAGTDDAAELEGIFADSRPEAEAVGAEPLEDRLFAEPEESEGDAEDGEGLQSMGFPELGPEPSAASFVGDAQADPSDAVVPGARAYAPVGAGEAAQGARPRQRGADDTSDLEALPEIDSLDGAAGGAPAAGFNGSDFQEADKPAKRTPSTPREVRKAQIEETVKDQNPESLAKAVRTFLKKDQ